jgi:hypothetical protein
MMEETSHGTLSAVVDARHPASNSGADLRFRRPALNLKITLTKKITPTKKAARAGRLFHFTLPIDQLLPPITARTVLSGPKSSAPST